MLEDMLRYKTTLTVNAITVQAANKSIGPKLVRAHIKTLLTTTGMQSLLVVQKIPLNCI